MASRESGRTGCNPRFLIAIVLALVAIVSYYGSTSVNPTTGEVQRVAMTAEQESALGLQAAPRMLAEYGGASRNQRASALVEQVGQDLVAKSDARKSPYEFRFHLLADRQTVNAFALPGGQIFITEALLGRLETRGQLAGVLGHEIGHVIGRHGAEQLAKARLSQGLTGAAVIATYDPERPGSLGAAVMAQMINQMVNLKWGRDDEIESDRLGLKFMAQAGYDPTAMIQVMRVLKSAGGGGRQPEFFSTHPDPDNRIERIENAIRELFPSGLPDRLIP